MPYKPAQCAVLDHGELPSRREPLSCRLAGAAREGEHVSASWRRRLQDLPVVAANLIAALAKVDDGSARGLSPLARGNRPSRTIRASRCGPIPARAGQPSARMPGISAARAYPRSRGNPEVAGAQIVGVGPIPARAGQPQYLPRFVDEQRAYPRSRGATPKAPRADCVRPGLSPLARGNPPTAARRPARPGPIPARPGPIPARAGQPHRQALTRRA